MEFPGFRVVLAPVLVPVIAFAALTFSLVPSNLDAQTASVGAVFPLFGTDEFCESSALGAFQVGFETPISGSVDGQVEGYFAPNGFYPWPWTPVGGSGSGGGADAAQTPRSYDHNGGFRVTANALIGLTQSNRYGLKALVGAGVRRLGGADYSQGGAGEIERYGVESQIAPVVTFGLVADIDLTNRVALRLQGRGNAIFSGDLQLKGATGALDRTLASDTQTFAQANIGLAIGIGDRR